MEGMRCHLAVNFVQKLIFRLHTIENCTVRNGTGAPKVLVDTPKEKKSLGRSKSRREDTIKTDLKELGQGHKLDGSGSG